MYLLYIHPYIYVTSTPRYTQISDCHSRTAVSKLLSGFNDFSVHFRIEENIYSVYINKSENIST